MEVLDTPAAAVRIGLKPTTLETMRCRGGGPAFCRLGRGHGRIVYRVDDLDDYLAARVVSGTAKRMSA